MVQQKQEKPAIVLFSVRVVRPRAEMIVSGNESIVFHSIEFAPGNFEQLCGLALVICLEHEVIVRIMIVPTKGPTRNEPRTTRVGHRPGAKTRQEHEDSDVCVYVRHPGTFVEQPGVAF